MFKSFLFVACLISVLISVSSANAQAEDGTYDALVTTDSGTYTVPVEVEDGEVTHVIWPNGGEMSVDGGELSDGEAYGTNSRGDDVSIEIDDYSYDEEDEDEDY